MADGMSGFRLKAVLRTRAKGAQLQHLQLVFRATIVCSLWLLAGMAAGQNPAGPAPPAAPRGDNPQTFLQIVHAGGLVGYIIMFLSVVAVALAIEHVMTIRRGVLMPEGLAEKVRELMKQTQFKQAEQACKLQPSVLAFVLQAGISEIDGGSPSPINRRGCSARSSTSP
jgi:biopolymer transport protein ExbB